MTPAFTCMECGRTFDEPSRYNERHGLESPPYETVSACPYCGGAFAPTITCAGCGEPITGDYVLINQSQDCYCDACYILQAFGD